MQALACSGDLFTKYPLNLYGDTSKVPHDKEDQDETERGHPRDPKVILRFSGDINYVGIQCTRCHMAHPNNHPNSLTSKELADGASMKEKNVSRAKWLKELELITVKIYNFTHS